MTILTMTTATPTTVDAVDTKPEKMAMNVGRLIAQAPYPERFVLIGCLIGGMLKGGMKGADIFHLFDCAAEMAPESVGE